MVRGKKLRPGLISTNLDSYSMLLSLNRIHFLTAESCCFHNPGCALPKAVHSGVRCSESCVCNHHVPTRDDAARSSLCQVLVGMTASQAGPSASLHSCMLL